jgi:valyl-tRNA synthetase
MERVDEKYTHNIATNSRGGGVIEPQIKEQWFVSVNAKFKFPTDKLKGISNGQEVTLKEVMIKVVESGQIEIIPDRFEKTYFHWIENLRDWCISRQIWYGHRIPVWYKETDKGKETYCGIDAPQGDGWSQDEDTLDTWFSSGLWTFSTLGWPENTDDLMRFHPTSALETGYDIIFFWVARMILMTTYVLGDIPFERVYLHGLVRDDKGRKMSKSLGNIIDPLTFIDKYGADALRMALIIGTSPGNDSKLSEDKVRGYKNFANKLWNISRFVLSTVEYSEYDSAFNNWSEADKTIMSEAKTMLEDITSDVEAFRFYLAGEKLYHYIWHTFADKILEDSKKIVSEGKPEEIVSRKQLLIQLLRSLIICLHPFMPYVTEEIWQLMGNPKMLMVESWPISKQ